MTRALKLASIAPAPIQLIVWVNGLDGTAALVHGLPASLFNVDLIWIAELCVGLTWGQLE